MSQNQILINQMSYQNNTEIKLFNDLNITFLPIKTGLVGRNGMGKTTLLKLIMGDLQPHTGSLQVTGSIAYLPQNFAGRCDMTIAELLGVHDKLAALARITAGSIDERDYLTLNDDWHIAERIQAQLLSFGLHGISDKQCVSSLSGGELTRLLLAKTFLTEADYLLLDEPTNHLDYSARQQLYDAIKSWQNGMIVVSHDRELLNLMDEIVELTSLGAVRYGGNYADYEEQRDIDQQAKAADLLDAKKYMQKTCYSIQGSREKHQKKQSHGRELRQSGSIDKLSANSKKGRSERSQSKMLIKHDRMLKDAENLLQAAKEKIAITEDIYVDLPKTSVPNGKMMIEVESLSFAYHSAKPIISDLNFMLQGPERVAITGDNGSGKTTFIKLLLGKLTASTGKIVLGTERVSYLDQNTSQLNPALSVIDNYLHLNPAETENEAYNNLARFLFKNVAAKKLVSQLSGGEKLRALLACVLMSKQPPQLLILDEPTNHLDLYSLKNIESALKNYRGAMLVISHDAGFLAGLGIERQVQMVYNKAR